MNYIGSKKRLLDWLFDRPEMAVPLNGPRTVFIDAFSGTGVVSTHVKATYPDVGILALDQLLFCRLLVQARLQDASSPVGVRVAALCKELQSKLYGTSVWPAFDGGFYQSYAVDRTYFTPDNGRRIEYVLHRLTLLEGEEAAGLHPPGTALGVRAALIEAADRVANVTSVYGACLGSIKASADKAIFPVPLAKLHRPVTDVFVGESLWHLDELAAAQPDLGLLLNEAEEVVLYLDPPYNTRSYASNYHIPETLAHGDINHFTPRGKTGLRPLVESPFTSKVKTPKAFEEMFDIAVGLRIAYPNLERVTVALSYSAEGTMSRPDILQMMRDAFGNVKLDAKVIPRFKSHQKGEQVPDVVEFLFISTV